MQTAGTVEPRMVALAAALEALADGHVRVLAAELRGLLEAACGPSAAVVSLATRKGPGR